MNSDAVAATAGSSTPSANAAVASSAVSADPTKTGQAYTEELEHSPVLFEKQKEICHGQGAALQRSAQLEAPCAAWDMARSDLELEQQSSSAGVKNTDSL